MQAKYTLKSPQKENVIEIIQSQRQKSCL